MMTMAPISQANPLGQYLAEMTTITAQAAEQSQLPYSIYWETQADGSWKYRLNIGGYAVNRWVQDEVDHNWYLLDDNGVMRTGVYKSYGKYYLLSEVHDGHYGHLVKNGETYNGVFISADTSAENEGALTDSTLSALRGAGVNVDNVQDVSGTTHTTGGQDVASSQEQSNNGKAGSSSGNTQQPSGNGSSNSEWDLDGDGVITMEEILSNPKAQEQMNALELPGTNKYGSLTSSR